MGKDQSRVTEVYELALVVLTINWIVTGKFSLLCPPDIMEIHHYWGIIFILFIIVVYYSLKSLVFFFVFLLLFCFVFFKTEIDTLNSKDHFFLHQGYPSFMMHQQLMQPKTLFKNHVYNWLCSLVSFCH